MFDDSFRPFGLTNFQFSLLTMLNRPSPPTIGRLAEDLAMDRTTITAKLKPLGRRRLLTVRRDDELIGNNDELSRSAPVNAFVEQQKVVMPAAASLSATYFRASYKRGMAGN
jgi:DNA-binding transcriptional ArsR family regulator